MSRRLAAATAVAMVGSALVAVPALAISNGTPAAAGNYGFVAKINTGSGACTGALVSPTWVMTAADCFPGSPQGGAPTQATTVTVGRNDLTTTAGHVARVVNLVPRTDRNLMLAQLDTAITDITPLAVSTTAPTTGEVLRVAGYGRTEADWVPNLLHTNTFSVTASSPTTIALTGANGSDTCKGDAGGPAIREVNGKTELAGISSTSWQHGCLAVTQTQQGSTETRVDDLATWLRPMLACGGDGPAAGIAVPPSGGAPRWFGWDSPDGTIVGTPAVTSSANGRLDLFAKGAGNALYHSTFSNGAWSAPESLGDGLASDPAAVSWAPGRFDLFARGSDNSLQHKWFDGVWHDWESLGGAIQYAPAVASWGPGRLDVLAIGTDNALYHRAFDGQWRDWEYHGGILNSSPAAVSWAPNRVDVFARGGVDNALYHIAWDGAWHDWEWHGGLLTSAPTVASWGPNRLDAFALGTDSTVQHLAWDGGWQPFESRRGRLVSAPAAVSWGTNRIDVFAAGTNNATCHTTFG